VKRWVWLIGIIALIFILMMYRSFTSSNNPFTKSPEVDFVEEGTEGDVLTEEEVKRLPKEEVERLEVESYPETTIEQDHESIMVGFAQSLYAASFFKDYEGIAVNIEDSYFPEEMKRKSNTEKGKYVYDTLTKGKRLAKSIVHNSSLEDKGYEYDLTIEYFDKMENDIYRVVLKMGKISSIKKMNR
jgi:hypothetical protein